MGRYYRIVGRQVYIEITLLCVVAFSLVVPAELHAQTKKGLQMNMAPAGTSQVSTAAEEGMPERGRFQFWYSYSGKSIDAAIQVSKNGKVIGQQVGMYPVTNALLVDATIEKGDVIVVSSHFKGSDNSGEITRDIMFGHSAGLWYSYGNGSFYALDQEGNIIDLFGTWNFNLTLTPPWNGIEVTADPESIAPGDSSVITLQPYETPSEPVIIPEVTYINLQTSLLGDLIGGLGLPEYGIRYTQGFVNAPWGLLRNTNILYEVHPSIEASDDFEIPVVAYSPYDHSKSGSTNIKVEEGLIYTRFSQTDPQWADSTYDAHIKEITSTDTTYYDIGTKGCALTAMASVLSVNKEIDIDPLKLNENMTKNNQFYDGDVYWGALNTYPGNDKVFFYDRVGNGLRKDQPEENKMPLSKIDKYLERDYPVIAQVYNQTSNGGHWVLITSKKENSYNIIDPGYKNRTTLESYNDSIYRAVVYKVN